MIVISDTTPLISLLKIGRLDLLRELFSEVVIPQAVYDELTFAPRFQAEADMIKNSVFIKKINECTSFSKSKIIESFDVAGQVLNLIELD